MSTSRATESPAGTDRREGASGPRWPEVALLVGTWVVFTVPQLLDLLRDGRGFVAATDEQAEAGGLEAMVVTGLNAALLGLCAVLVLMRVRTLPWRRPVGWLLLLAPWVWAVGHLVVLGRPPGAPALLYPAVVTAAWAVRPGLASVRVLGGLVTATAAVSLVLGALLPGRALYEDYEGADLDKSLGPFGILAALQPSGNNLGVALAIGLPAVWCLRTRWRWLALAVTVLALAWSFSRTAWAATIVAVVAALLVRYAPRRTVVAGTGLGLLGAAVVVVPFVVSDPTAFANRATFWIGGLEAWREQPLVGHGTDWFKVVASGDDNLGGYAYQAHNQAVQALVTGGVVLMLLIGALLAYAAVRAVRLLRTEGPGSRLRTDGAGSVPRPDGDAPGPLALWGVTTMAALLAVCVAEVPLGTVDRSFYLPFVLLPLVVLVLAPEGDRRPATAEPEVARA